MSSERISVSKQMFMRFERRKKWRRFVSISFLVIYSIYLIWRATILNENSMALSLLYFFAEFLGLFLGFSIVLKSWSYNYRAPKVLIHGLKVDIFIPTYKEPLHIIRRTAIAAKEISYPHQTFILDDGKNEQVKKLAEEIGVNYLSREENLHAKAGNLNYGLEHSKADFVMVFDADHIALPHALDIMLGFFSDEKIAMVQTPQDYYNTNAFQHMNCKKTGAFWTDQSFFYNITEPCQDSIDNAQCVGTGVVYRRKALDEIGGIPTATVTEDTHTSLKLNKIGYKTVYLNESIAYGIASSDLAEYYKTRRRWTHGNIHVVKDEKLFSCKGLNLRQRCLHIAPMFNCIEGWQQILVLIIPICTLMFGLAPFEISVFNVIITFCFPFFSYLMLQEIGCGFSRLWTNEIFSMVRWPIYLQASAAWFGCKLKWSSSVKNIKGEVNWRLMIPQLSILFLSIAALIVAFLTLQKSDFKTGPLFLFFKEKFLEIFGVGDPSYQPIDVHSVLASGYTVDLVIIAGMWVVYNIFRVIFFVKKVIDDSKNSHEFYRFSTPLPITIDEEKNIFGHVLEISEEWIKFESAEISGASEVEKILIHLPAKILEINIKIEKVSNNIVEAKIIWQNENARDDLARAIYSVDWHREFKNRNAYFLTPSDLVLKLFGIKTNNANKYQQWQVFLYDKKPAVIAEFTQEKNRGTIILFEELKIGQILNGIKISNKKSEEFKLKIIAAEPLSSLVEKGLDGASVRRFTYALE